MGAARELVTQTGRFAEANVKFEDIKKALLSKDLLHAGHGELERFIAGEGRELLRLLLQGHLDARGEARAVGPVIGEDGVERTHLRQDTSRELATTVGEVRVSRARYEGRGVEGRHPADAELQLPPGKYSHELQRLLALQAAQVSFDKAVDFVAEATGVDVPKRQAEQLVRGAAKDFEAFYAERADAAPPSDKAFLVMSVDQKGVVVRREDLLPATKKKAEAGRKLETRFTRGEPHARKRMATVAAVYFIEPDVRDAASVIAGLRHIKPAEPVKRPRPQDKRVWASLERSLATVAKEMFDEAERMDPKHERPWLVLLDGDLKLEAAIKREVRARGVQVSMVLDAIHALQYLWSAGHQLCPEGTPELERWVLERFERILNGHASDVAAGMRRSATKRGLSPKQRKPIDKAANYFLKRRNLMHYDLCLQAGTPIATGVIEGACRTLINDRLDVTGARWSLDGAEAVLKLRALVQSRDFEDYWGFHTDHEYHRNHASKYIDEKPPGLVLGGSKPRLKLVR
jgi:hypothetical protein